ncbi:hypothetical protein [Flavobacterium sp. CFS9]
MKKITLLFLLFFTIYGTAQKSAPVAGDIITLLDLLTKDYTINPENLDENVITDRAKVLAILKAYVPDFSSSVLFISSHKDIEKIKNYEEALRSFSSSGVSVNEKYTVNKAVEEYVAKYDSLKELKRDYYTSRFDYDNNQLLQLSVKLKENNPYLAVMVQAFSTKYDAINRGDYDKYSKRSNSISVNKGFPIAGGLGLEVIIDELAKFIAEGIKKELTLYAVEKIRNYLTYPEPDNYAYELLAIMPETTEYLKSFTADQLVNINDQLKQHIENDLNSILKNMANLRHTPKVTALISKYPDLDFAFEGLELLPRLKEIKNPVDYFGILENSRMLNTWSISPNTTKYNIAQGIKLLSMMAYSLTVIESGEQRFLTVDALTTYASDKNFYLLYIGLLHQQNRNYYNVNFKNNAGVKQEINFRKIMSVVPADNLFLLEQKKEVFQRVLVPVLENAEKIYNLSQELKQHKTSETKSYENVYSFVDSFINITDELGRSLDILAHEGIFGSEHLSFSISSKLKPYTKASRFANLIVLDLQQKKYSAALTTALKLPLALTEKNDSQNELLKIESVIRDKVTSYNLISAFTIDMSAYDAQIMSVIKAETDKLLILYQYLPTEGYSKAENSLESLISLSDAMSVSFNKNLAQNAIQQMKTELSQKKLKLAQMPGLEKLFTADIRNMNKKKVNELLNSANSYLLSFQLYIPPIYATLHDEINSFRTYVLSLREDFQLADVQREVDSLKNNLMSSNLEVDLAKTTLAEEILAIDFSSADQAIIDAAKFASEEFNHFGSTLPSDFSQLKLDISTFKSNVETLARVAPLDRATLVLYINSLKSSVERDKIKLLNYLILDAVKNSKAYLKLKGDYKYASIISMIDNDLQNYAEAYFDYFVFNEPLQVDIEKDLYAKLKIILPQLTENTNIKDDVALRLLGFLNDMAISKNSEDVKTAIQNFAEPTGTSSLKEYSKFNISLNTYPGILAGWEYSDPKSEANFVGITAPVGLYAQFFPMEKWGSIGIFIPIIDIGAPVRVRLDSDRDTESLPEFDFADIFSPGLYISYGFPKSPFAVNFGVQYGPKLRNIPEADNGSGTQSFTSLESYRIGFGFLIDIPILTIFNKAKF